MRSFILMVMVCAIACLGSPARGVTAEEQDLIGTWTVSLYFSKTQPPSSTVMVIDAIEDGVVTGTFYGSPILKGRVATFEDDVILSVVTADASGEYLSSGRLKGAVIRGQTFSVGRDFLMPWTAVRAEPEEVAVGE